MIAKHCSFRKFLVADLAGKHYTDNLSLRRYSFTRNPGYINILGTSPHSKVLIRDYFMEMNQ